MNWADRNDGGHNAPILSSFPARVKASNAAPDSALRMVLTMAPAKRNGSVIGTRVTPNDLRTFNSGRSSFPVKPTLRSFNGFLAGHEYGRSTAVESSPSAP